MNLKLGDVVTELDGRGQHRGKHTVIKLGRKWAKLSDTSDEIDIVTHAIRGESYSRRYLTEEDIAIGAAHSRLRDRIRLLEQNQSRLSLNQITSISDGIVGALIKAGINVTKP